MASRTRGSRARAAHRAAVAKQRHEGGLVDLLANIADVDRAVGLLLPGVCFAACARTRASHGAR